MNKDKNKVTVERMFDKERSGWMTSVNDDI